MSVKMDINFLLAMCFDSKFISQTRKSVTKMFLLLIFFTLPASYTLGDEEWGHMKIM